MLCTGGQDPAILSPSEDPYHWSLTYRHSERGVQSQPQGKQKGRCLRCSCCVPTCPLSCPWHPACSPFSVPLFWGRAALHDSHFPFRLSSLTWENCPVPWAALWRVPPHPHLKPARQDPCWERLVACTASFNSVTIAKSLRGVKYHSRCWESSNEQNRQTPVPRSSAGREK